jgi:phospho-N-acetylmuramoyl-pentapeptide-transferase
VIALAPPAIETLGRWTGRARVREDTPESHRAKAGTPSMGGVIFLPVAAVTMAGLSWPDPTGLGVALTMLAMGALGAVDDLQKAFRPNGRGLRAREKFVIQFALAAGVLAWARLWGDAGPSLGRSIALAVGFVWFVNAANITDGLDGLASGLAAAASVALVVAGVVSGRAGLAVPPAAILGACLGFLVFNRKPARVWMGDTGSLALGGGLAATAIYGSNEWVLLVAALPFSVELASVVIQVIVFQWTKRVYHLSEGRRVFRRSPLHHHFEELGHDERRIVAGFWTAGVACAAAAVAGVAMGVGR